MLTSLAGLFLSREEGYDPEALLWHKWSGVSVSVFTLAWYYFRRRIGNTRFVSSFVSIIAVIIIIFAGHQGAGITHGQNFLLAPMLPEKRQRIVPIEEALVYTDMVKPILEEKCTSCHNSKKAKGALVMETKELLLKGGKSGRLWDSAAADLGIMLRRVHLPLEAKKHMPPQGKPQLTDDEVEILTQWIRKGSSFDLRVADLDPSDTLHQLAVQKFTAAEIAEYDFEEADPATVEKLNTANRVISNEALGSPALAVNFFNSTLFNADQLKQLDAIKKQVVSLDLAKMPLKDADLPLIAGFENLRRLNLSFTSITGVTLSELKKLKHLKTLSLSGTQIKSDQVKQLQSFPQLKTVYAWNTPLTTADINNLKQQAQHIRFEAGFSGDTLVLKLSPPVLLNEEAFITKDVPLKIKHYIQGTTIRFTTDGSDPDSLKSPVFTGKEMISSNTHIKAKAFKPGWHSSKIMEASIYKSTYTPDSIIYLTQADVNFKDEENKYLFNREKGESDYRFGNWVGFRNNRMECLLQFDTPVPVTSVTLSTLADPGAHIMPAKSIEIWGGPKPDQLKLLSKLTPDQPKEYAPSARKGFECKFDTATVSCMKIIVNPVDKLPKWHAAKGKKGWFFVDEVLLN